MSKRIQQGGIIDPWIPVRVAERVIAKRWPGMTREQWMGAYRVGTIEPTGIAADVAACLFFWLPLAERASKPGAADGGTR